jgi:hypothetical protein
MGARSALSSDAVVACLKDPIVIYLKGSLLGLLMFCYAAIFIRHERWGLNSGDIQEQTAPAISDFEIVALRELEALESDRPAWMITAAYKGDIVRMRQLIDEGVDVNAMDERGVTALISAASGLQHEAVLFLLSHSADRSAQTNEGFTAYDFAKNQLDDELATILAIKKAPR